MPIKAQCPKCGGLLVLPEAGGGNQVVCPGCGTRLSVPASPSPADALAPPPRSAAGRWRVAPLLTGGLVALGVVLLGLILAAALLRGGSSAWKYLPHDSKMVAVVNVPAILQSDVFRKSVRDAEGFKKFESELLERTGLKPDDVARVFIASTDFGPQSGKSAIFVIQCTSAVDRDEFLKRGEKEQGRWEEERVGAHTVSVGKDIAFCFPDDRTIVGGKPEAVRAALDPGRSAGLNPSMQKMADSLNLSRGLALALVVPSEVPAMPPGAPISEKLFQQVRGLILHADVRSDVLLEATVMCNDKDTAESIRKMIDGLLEMAKQNRDMPANVRELVKTISVTSSGTEVHSSMKITGESLDEAIDQGLRNTPLAR